MAAKILLLLMVCALAGCAHLSSKDENAAQRQTAKAEKLFLSMERTGCYGTCPVYNLSVEPDGKVLFDGKFHTQTVGKAESSLSKETMEKLIAEIRSADFFSLKDDYSYGSDNCPSTATDMAAVTLTVRLDEQSKTIKHYLGCLDENERSGDFMASVFPPQLYKLENKIDEIVETKRWIGERK